MGVTKGFLAGGSRSEARGRHPEVSRRRRCTLAFFEVVRNNKNDDKAPTSLKFHVRLLGLGHHWHCLYMSPRRGRSSSPRAD